MGGALKNVIEDYVKSLGFDYMCASNKEEYTDCLGHFLEVGTEKSVIFELKYDRENDQNARDIIRNL